jgi:hypothetical protein
MRKLLVAAALAAVAAVLVIPSGTAVAAPATGFLVSAFDGPVPIGPRACLQASGGSSGDSLHLNDCVAGRRSQNFTVDFSGAITTIVVNGKCVDVQGGARHNGARVQIWSCNRTGAQQWQAVLVPGFGQYFLRNPISGRCLRANTGGAVIEDCPTGFDPTRLDMVWNQAPQIF